MRGIDIVALVDAVRESSPDVFGYNKVYGEKTSFNDLENGGHWYIAAVKCVRETFGTGLHEAMRLIQAYVYVKVQHEDALAEIRWGAFDEELKWRAIATAHEYEML